MSTVTDEQVRELAATAVPYSLVLLWWGDDRFQDGADAIEAAHQRRMVSLRADGVIAILCPVGSDTLAGIGHPRCPARRGPGGHGRRPVRARRDDALRRPPLPQLPR